MKTDITQYSDQELSLLVFNTEDLYEGRHWPGFFEELNNRYVYRSEQLKELEADLIEDLEELQNEK